jgi:hypothetical protein
VQAVLHPGLITQLLDPADPRGIPLVQKIVGVVAAQFNPGKAVFLGEGEVLLQGLRSSVKA